MTALEMKIVGLTNPLLIILEKLSFKEIIILYGILSFYSRQEIFLIVMNVFLFENCSKALNKRALKSTMGKNMTVL